MYFDVPAQAYGRFMGQYSERLSVLFAAAADLLPGAHALDVGCGPGALTAQLVERLGADSVTAIDPSSSFVDAARQRFPDVEVRTGVAEALPFPDDSFDAALAQLVVHFMSDPVAGLREMGRVTRPGGLVMACVSDNAGHSGPLSLFWSAVHDLTPEIVGEGVLAGSREGHLAQLCAEAGLREIESSVLTVRVGFATFDDWWQPYLLGVGPAGAHVAPLEVQARERLRLRCAELLPEPPFEVSASAWCVRATV